LFDLTRKFSFGIDLDDPWRYAGLREPKSMILPHLLSVSLPEGRVLEMMEDATIRLHGDAEPEDAAGRAVLSLAENLKDLKVAYARCWFPWRFFEPTPVPEAELDALLEKSYQSWPMDKFVMELASRGIAVVPVLGCGYQRMLPDGLDVDRTPELYLRRVAVHARLVVRHYRSSVRYWQIENEPNWWRMHEAGGWRHGASWLESNGFGADLLQILNEAVHEEDPAARTIVNIEGDEGVASASTYSKYCDVLGLDFYPNYRAPSPVSAASLRGASDVAKTAEKPTFIAETGYPSGPQLLGYDESKQAEYLKAACEVASGSDGIASLGVWRYVDGPWRSFPEQENHFGLIDSKGKQKLAWGALKEAIADLS
jgi:hypothetical protein